jgi:cyanophycinase-like exopeptidase
MESSRAATGRIVLFGSGETGKHGRLVQEQELMRFPAPVKVAILETPAGFQPNVDAVTGKLRVFYERNLQNAKPLVTVVSARHRASEHDPDDPMVAALLDAAAVIFAGPGSPTYTVRQLAGTATWAALRRRLAAGATVILSSAAAIAAGRIAIPVYELFKVGDDPFWLPGLDLLSDLGLSLAVVPHWNNAEGGDELDTSHCFVGRERFARLLDLRPPDVAVLGIDEHTAVLLDPEAGSICVKGVGTATLIAGDRTEVVTSGGSIAMSTATLSGGAERRPAHPARQ